MKRLKNLTDISGLLSERISVRKVGKRVVITNYPKRKMGKPSAQQSIRQNKFKDATRYANHQMEREDSRELYSKGITKRKRSVYLVAISDYLNAPEVEFIDTFEYRGVIGNNIRVTATDDFMVTRVKIAIINTAGITIEGGDAVRDILIDKFWHYKVTAANPTLPGTIIRATAYDRPGNKGIAEVVIDMRPYSSLINL